MNMKSIEELEAEYKDSQAEFRSLAMSVALAAESYFRTRPGSCKLRIAVDTIRDAWR